MTFDWDAFISRLDQYPAGYHRLLPPCPSDQMQIVRQQLGEFPALLEEMLKRVNGAQLFICAGPLVSFFRLSSTPQLPTLEWSADWCIDSFTARWRAVSVERQNDWAIAMSNYGGLILLDMRGTVKEWDTGERRWVARDMPFDKWIEQMIGECETTMAELEK